MRRQHLTRMVKHGDGELVLANRLADEFQDCIDDLQRELPAGIHPESVEYKCFRTACAIYRDCRDRARSTAADIQIERQQR